MLCALRSSSNLHAPCHTTNWRRGKLMLLPIPDAFLAPRWLCRLPIPETPLHLCGIVGVCRSQLYPVSLCYTSGYRTPLHPLEGLAGVHGTVVADPCTEGGALIAASRQCPGWIAAPNRRGRSSHHQDDARLPGGVLLRPIASLPGDAHRHA
ncbi:hypothetical protein NDU88_010406 [Pleurodeles waltl]|uniref:Uncharacterized protein n=1 Tax=Pleurodeles waltl TaxID=8319 RepID=A0AAV7QUC8_PLEWA|nr:hypothetical protein NDU88_010406 [Pleurodeles waltl]